MKHSLRWIFSGLIFLAAGAVSQGSPIPIVSITVDRGPIPNPAFVNENVVTNLTVHFQDSTKHNEIPPPSGTSIAWSIDQVMRNSAVTTFYTGSFSPPDAASTKLTTSFPASGHFDVQVSVTVSNESWDFPSAAVATVTLGIEVASFRIKSLEFTSDHGILCNGKTTFQSLGEEFVKPEWKCTGGNDPITHSWDKNVALTLVFQTPPGTPAVTADVSGTADGLTFPSKSVPIFNGASADFASTERLPNKVLKVSKSIKWAFSIAGTVVLNQTTGAHVMYVTISNPLVAISVKRCEWAIGPTSGATSITAAAKKIRSAAPRFDVKYNQPLSWRLLDENKAADCISLSRVCQSGLKVIGVPAEVGKAYPTVDGSAGEEPINANTCAKPIAKKDFIFNGVSFHAMLVAEGPNAFEGFYSVNDPSGKRFTVAPPGGPFENSGYPYLEVFDSVFHDQSWVWSDNQRGVNAAGHAVRVKGLDEVPNAPHIVPPAVPAH